MPDFNIRIRDDFNLKTTWSDGISIGNCGMHVIYQFMCMPKGAATADAYGRVTYAPPVAGITMRQVYDGLCANLDKLLNHIPPSTSLVLLTDRVADNLTTGRSVANPDAPPGTAFIDTAFLMRALRKKKFGMVSTSPVVENPNHTGVSAIMGAFWVPPNKLQHVLYEKIARSGVLTEEQLTANNTRLNNSPLKRGADAFTQDFYGRQS